MDNDLADFLAELDEVIVAIEQETDLDALIDARHEFPKMIPAIERLVTALDDRIFVLRKETTRSD